jgi:hypothetical protein
MEILQASVSGQISEESLLITDYRPLIPEFGSISSSRCQTARGARPCNREDAIASAREFKFLNERDLASAARLRRGFGGHLCGLKSGPPTEAATSREGWWSQTGSNRRPPACKAGALPTELWPRQVSVVSNLKTKSAARYLITDT